MMTDAGLTRREAIKKVLRAGAYVAPALVVTTVPVGVAAATPAPAAADIGLTATIGGSISNLTQVTVEATNLGPSNATGVAISVPMPPNFFPDYTVPVQGTYDAGTGVWAVGNVAVGATARFVFIWRPTGAVTFRATRIASNPPDPNPANDTASASFGCRSGQIVPATSNLTPPISN